MGLLDNALGNSYSNPWGQNDPTKVGQGQNGSNGVQGPSTAPGGLDATKGSILAPANTEAGKTGASLTGAAAHDALGAQTDDGKNGRAIVDDANKRMGVTVSPIGQAKKVDEDAKPSVQTGYDKDGNLMKVSTNRQTGVKSFETTDANGKKLNDSTENAKTGEKTSNKYFYKADGSSDGTISQKTDSKGNFNEVETDAKGNLVSEYKSSKDDKGITSFNGVGYKDGKVNNKISGTEDGKGNSSMTIMDANDKVIGTKNQTKNADGSTTVKSDSIKDGKVTASSELTQNTVDGSYSQKKTLFDKDGKAAFTATDSRDKDGNFTREKQFENGRVERNTVDAKGKAKSSYIQYKQEDGSFLKSSTTYKDGQSSTVSNVVKKDGSESTAEYTNGKKMTETNKAADGKVSTTDYSYNKDGKLGKATTSSKDDQGTTSTETKSYGADGKVSTLEKGTIDKDGNGSSKTFDVKTKKLVGASETKVKDGVKETVAVGFDQDGTKTSATKTIENKDKSSKTTALSYEKDGKTVKSTTVTDKDKDGNTVTDTIEGGKVVAHSSSTKDANNVVTTKNEAYDKDGNKTQTVDKKQNPDGTFTENKVAYEKDGKTVKSTEQVTKDKDGTVVKETKDENGIKKEETKKDGSSTVTKTATDGSSVTTTKDASGNKTTEVKDKDGKVLSTKSEPAPKKASVSEGSSGESENAGTGDKKDDKNSIKDSGDSAFQALALLNKVLQDSGRIQKPRAAYAQQAPAWNFKRHD